MPARWLRPGSACPVRPAERAPGCRSAGRGRASSAARVQMRMTLQKRAHDQADQCCMRNAAIIRDEAEVGIIGAKACQRIDLNEMRPAVFVVADVDASAVAAA